MTERFVRCARHHRDVLVVIWEDAVPTGRMKAAVNGIAVSERGAAWAAECDGHIIMEPATTDLDVFVAVATERWA